MMKFIDGPAVGAVLYLRRAPTVLRVTQTAAGSIDALDQVADVPEPDGKLTAYLRVGPAEHVHVCRQPRSVSGWFVAAEYRVLSFQPPDETMRSTEAWHAWCEINKPVIMQEYYKYSPVKQGT